MFITYKNIKKGKHGQIAVFLLIALVILLIAAVALVNMGEVGVRRLRTANAADSAALAGASALAAVANNISEANRWLRWQFVALQLAILIAPPTCIRQLCTEIACPQQLITYSMYRYNAGLQLMNYLFLMRSSEDGFRMARAQAHRTAFGNVGIDEAQRRDRQTREILQPRLSRWLDEQDVQDPFVASPGEMRGASYTFRWFGYSIDTASGEEARETTPNEVTSTVNINDCAFALDPMPAVPVVKTYKFFYTGIRGQPLPKGGCNPCKCIPDRYCTVVDQVAFAQWQLDMLAQGREAALFFAGLIGAFNLMQCTQPDVESILAGLLALMVTPFVVGVIVNPPKKQCIGICQCDGTRIPAPKPAIVMVMYWVPVPWIRDIGNDDDIRITSTVEFSEPSKQLGFWRRRQTRVTSSATARVIPGNFDDPGSYDAELTGAQ